MYSEKMDIVIFKESARINKQRHRSSWEITLN